MKKLTFTKKLFVTGCNLFTFFVWHITRVQVCSGFYMFLIVDRLTLMMWCTECCIAGCCVESSAADVELSCAKCDQCFTDGVAAFESISDIVNVALLHSNRGKLMRLHAQIAASRLVDSKKREFTSAERNYFLQVTVLRRFCSIIGIKHLRF